MVPAVFIKLMKTRWGFLGYSVYTKPFSKTATNQNAVLNSAIPINVEVAQKNASC